jgi:hypothetical protein
MQFLLPALLTLAMHAAPSESLGFTDAVAVMTYPAGVDCGVLKLWGAVDFDHEGGTDRVYVMCATADKLPLTGAICSVRFHMGTIDANAADGRATPFEGRIVDTMNCAVPLDDAAI